MMVESSSGMELGSHTSDWTERRSQIWSLSKHIKDSVLVPSFVLPLVADLLRNWMLDQEQEAITQL